MVETINVGNTISDRRRILEIIAVVITGIGKLLFIDLLKLHFVFIVSATLLWGLYIIVRVKKHKQLIYYWGLSLSNSKKTFKIVGTVAAVSIALFVSYGLYYNTIVLSWNLAFVLLLYPIWGLIQQFLVMSLFANNLSDYKGAKLNYYSTILITSFLFSIVHFPSVPLIIATFFMALFYSVLFLKERNIIPLGIFHGILGGLFFYFILQKDTWSIFMRHFN